MKTRREFERLDPPVNFESEVMKDECKAIIINKFFSELKDLVLDKNDIYTVKAFCIFMGKESVIRRAKRKIAKNLRRKQLKEEEDLLKTLGQYDHYKHLQTILDRQNEKG
jgi:hypothetical protein